MEMTTLPLSIFRSPPLSPSHATYRSGDHIGPSRLSPVAPRGQANAGVGAARSSSIPPRLQAPSHRRAPWLAMVARIELRGQAKPHPASSPNAKPPSSPWNIAAAVAIGSLQVLRVLGRCPSTPRTAATSSRTPSAKARAAPAGRQLPPAKAATASAGKWRWGGERKEKGWRKKIGGARRGKLVF
jgi:hypothetical protein